ncbi:MAG: ABC transporter permease [Oligoflexus sp.]
MLIYIIKRLSGLIPVAIGVLIIVATMIHVVPGDPVDTILGDYASNEDKEQLRTALGLDQPAWQQVFSYFANVISGNFGTSLVYSRPVLEMILERLPATIELAITSLIVALFIAIPLGLISAWRQGTWLDLTAMGFAVSGVAIPNFWLGPLLVLVFSLELGWLPVSEREGFLSYILPSITMGTALAAALSRMTRNSILDTVQEDFVRTARAKGCSELKVMFVHVFRNASLPLVTVVGLQFGVLLTGAVITEKIFDWPGLGSLLIEGIQARDYPIIQGCVLFFASSYLLVNLVTDLVYAFVDPRIKLEG